MPAKRTKEVSKFFTYKGKPLVRCGDIIYFGDMNDPYVVKLTIQSKKKYNDLEIADKVSIQLMSTSFSISSRKQIIKSSTKNSLYFALDVADAWLTRALTSPDDESESQSETE